MYEYLSKNKQKYDELFNFVYSFLLYSYSTLDWDLQMGLKNLKI